MVAFNRVLALGDFWDTTLPSSTLLKGLASIFEASVPIVSFLVN